MSYVVIGFDFDNIVDDAAFPAAAEVGMDDADNDVDGFANQVTDVAGCVWIFPGQTADTGKGKFGRVGMDCANAAFMSCVPGFQHGIRGAIPDFADDDSIRRPSHAVCQQSGHVVFEALAVCLLFGKHRGVVVGRALQFRQVFE